MQDLQVFLFDINVHHVVLGMSVICTAVTYEVMHSNSPICAFTVEIAANSLTEYESDCTLIQITSCVSLSFPGHKAIRAAAREGRETMLPLCSSWLYALPSAVAHGDVAAPPPGAHS